MSWLLPFLSLSLEYYGFIPFKSCQLGSKKSIIFASLILDPFFIILLGCLKHELVLLASTIWRIQFVETALLNEFKDTHPPNTLIFQLSFKVGIWSGDLNSLGSKALQKMCINWGKKSLENCQHFLKHSLLIINHTWVSLHDWKHVPIMDKFVTWFFF